MNILKKIFILGVKYIPVITMAGILINNTLCYKDIYVLCNFIDFILGNSVAPSFLFFIASFIFHFCVWHRLIIIANTIIIAIVYIDKEYFIPITNLELLILYYIVSGIFILLSTLIHVINKKRNEYKT